MKKLIWVILFIFIVSPVNAQVASPTPKAIEKVTEKLPTKNVVGTSENIAQLNTKIDELKEKVASKVAQLKLVEKRGFIGEVESVTDTQITLNDLHGKTKLIDVDEFTRFSSEDNDSFGISDIKKGTKLSILGLYNKESQRLLARFVNEVSVPVFLNGVITKIDEENFTVTLSTPEGKEFLVDVERVTKSFSFDNGDFETLGFSDLTMNVNATVVGFADSKEQDRVTASRLITFPGTPKNPRVKAVVEVNPTVVPSTGSGKKLTPLGR